MTTVVRGFNCALNLFAIMMLAATNAQAGLSGRLETVIEQDNRLFNSENSMEEWLDLVYEDPDKGRRGGLSLALSQQPHSRESELYQLYLQQDLNNARDQISLGRFLRTDTLGYYTLDGLKYRHKTKLASLSLYAGVPGRIESFRSIGGDAIYGIDLHTQPRSFYAYDIDARLGWQRLDQDIQQQRYHFGLRGVTENEIEKQFPSALSMSASYVVASSQWESAQLNSRWDLEEHAHLRLDYETYEPVSDELSFRDRFYSLYARGRQSQFKAAYQFKHDHQQTWSVAARRVVREFGSSGYGGTVGVERRSKRGLLYVAKAEKLELQGERVSSLFVDADKTLAASLRGGVSVVLQQQDKQLVGDNRAIGFDARVQRVLRFKALPSGLQFGASASHIWNTRLDDDYRLALRLSYSFDDRTREALQ